MSRVTAGWLYCCVGLCTCQAFQERYDNELNRLRGADVNDGKEAVIDGQADSNGIHQLHAHASGVSDARAAASGNDRLEQVSNEWFNQRKMLPLSFYPNVIYK